MKPRDEWDRLSGDHYGKGWIKVEAEDGSIAYAYEVEVWAPAWVPKPVVPLHSAVTVNVAHGMGFAWYWHYGPMGEITVSRMNVIPGNEEEA